MAVRLRVEQGLAIRRGEVAIVVPPAGQVRVRDGAATTAWKRVAPRIPPCVLGRLEQESSHVADRWVLVAALRPAGLQARDPLPRDLAIHRDLQRV